MRKLLKASVALLLTLAVAASGTVCFAANVEKEYYDYGSYVLLGDSIASGYSDIEYVFSEFTRVDDSYGAYVADDLGLDYYPMACPGFRTIELRHIFEDDYEGEDEYLYTGPHSDDEEIEAKISEIRKAVAEAGLVTLGVGGNDWGAYLGWVATDIMEQDGAFAEYVAAARKYMEENGVDNETLNKLIDLADTMDALPGLVDALPKALKYGLSTYFENWDHVIQDIYDLNPDVTLLVIGMCDTSVREPADPNDEADALKFSIGQMIVDFANTPMIESAEKFGYTYVDTTGTVCYENHPTAEGHRFIADKILEALPYANFPYEDVSEDSECFKAVEYMFKNGIMDGIGANTFSPDSALTKAQLASALYALAGKPDVEEISVSLNDTDDVSARWAVENGIMSAESDSFNPDGEVSALELAAVLLRMSTYDGFNISEFFKALSIAIDVLFSGGLLEFSTAVTRAEAAKLLMKYAS